MHKWQNKKMSFLFLLLILVAGARAGMENILQSIHRERRDTMETTTSTDTDVESDTVATTPMDFLMEQTTNPNSPADQKLADDDSSSKSKLKSVVEYILNDAYPVQEGLIPKDYRNLELPPIPPSLNPEKDVIPMINRTGALLAMVISKIRGLDEDEEELTLELDFEMLWRDGRLNPFVFGTGNVTTIVSLNPKLLNRIWHPHIYIDQLVRNSRPSFITVPAKLNIYTMPHPYVHYAIRSTVVTSCEMDYHYYPSDLTICKIDIKSYMYSADKFYLKWPNGKSVEVAENIEVPGFKTIIINGTNKVAKDVDGSKHSTLSFSIHLKRELSKHVIQTYLPSLIFIIISWCSFFIPDDHATERIGTAIVSLLSLMVMLDSIGQSIPKVTYLTGIHIWMMVCIFFVFLPLIEVFIVFKIWDLLKHAKESDEKDREQKIENINSIENPVLRINSNGKLIRQFEIENCDERKTGQVKLSILRMTVKRETLEKIGSTMEVITPWFVITLFVVFNAVYWPWLLNGEGSDELDS